jgi:hypothetical protein
MTTTKPTDPITVTYMPLEKLIRAPRNPKDHDIGSISNSMTRFGFTSPMLMNEKTGRIVAGHGRLDTLQRMKAMGKKPPGRILEKDGQWLVPVIRGVSFENEQEAEAYLIADNRLVEVGGWDEQEKAQILADLAAQGEEMLIGIGFDMQDVDELLKQLENEKQESENGQLDHQDNLPEEKDLPEAEMLLEKWGVQEGDVWNVADSYLLCGDAREQSDWQTLLDLAGTKSVGGIFTSPPYAMQRAKKNVPGYDGIPEDQYVQWWDALQQLAYQYLEPQGSFFLNIKPNVVEGQRVLYVFDLVLAMCRQWNWCLIDEFCWERAGNPGKWPNRFKNGFEGRSRRMPPEKTACPKTGPLATTTIWVVRIWNGTKPCHLTASRASVTRLAPDTPLLSPWVCQTSSSKPLAIRATLSSTRSLAPVRSRSPQSITKDAH